MLGRPLPAVHSGPVALLDLGTGLDDEEHGGGLEASDAGRSLGE